MQLKILSWNIWFDGYFDEIEKFLASFDADIMGLQEVVPNDPARDVIGFLASRGYHHVVAPVLTLKDGRKMSNAIMSKHPIIHSEIHTLSEENSRNAVQADIQVGDTILHVFTTHLFHTHQRPSEVQELQAKNLIKILPQEKMLVMGDFNALPESNAIQMMRSAAADTEGSNATPTWCQYEDGCPTCRIGEIRHKLDYIFTSKDLQTSPFEVHSSKGSDHLPVSTILEIRS